MMPIHEHFSSHTRYEVEVVETLAGVSPVEWQTLSRSNPFVSHGFLNGLHRTACIGPKSGWFPNYLLLYREGVLAGALPSYFKTHSRGEFVFDQGWAQAFERHGLSYYPKLVVASPFTPVQGPRLLSSDEDAREVLVEGLLALGRSGNASSVHVLFVCEEERNVLLKAGFQIRESVQFHWSNLGYGVIDDFLDSLSQEKRKKIKQDSRYVAAAGIKYEWLEAEKLTTKHLEFFFACYCNTYKEHWSTPYLNLDFFLEMHQTRALHFVLMLAHRDGVPVACALNVRGNDVLYGRYWGSFEFVKGLHFETCYLQAISYCINNGISVFEGGAQGEHKIARGMLPQKVYSAHWIADERFSNAIEQFLEEETAAVDEYVTRLQEESPFKNKV